MADKNRSLVQEFNLPETTPFWNERQLAQRWKLSLKTLQRWRSEGIGPVFVKMRSSVFYPIGEIILFEHSRRRRSTYESENDLFDVLPNDLIDALEASAKTGMPLLWFRSPTVRREMGIPHLRTLRKIRFSTSELMMWANKFAQAERALGRGPNQGVNHHDD